MAAIMPQTGGPTVRHRIWVLNQTDIVFACAGDLWTVHRGGGQPQPLTAGTGAERFRAW
jgi:hypothetical protein